MSSSGHRRGGCRGANGKQHGASCTQLADPKHGSWSYLLSYGSEPDTKRPGKRRRRQFRKMGFTTKGAAQSALAKLRASLDGGTYVEPSKTTLAEYAGKWLKRR